MSEPGGGIRLRTDRLGLGDSGLESLMEEVVGAGAWPGEVSPLRGWRELGDLGNLRGTKKEPIFCLILEDLIEERSH